MIGNWGPWELCFIYILFGRTASFAKVSDALSPWTSVFLGGNYKEAFYCSAEMNSNPVLLCYKTESTRGGVRFVTLYSRQVKVWLYANWFVTGRWMQTVSCPKLTVCVILLILFTISFDKPNTKKKCLSFHWKQKLMTFSQAWLYFTLEINLFWFNLVVFSLISVSAQTTGVIATFVTTLDKGKMNSCLLA